MFNRNKFIEDFYDLVYSRMTYRQILDTMKPYGVEVNKNSFLFWIKGVTKLKADQFMALCDIMKKDPNDYYEKTISDAGQGQIQGHVVA